MSASILQNLQAPPIRFHFPYIRSVYKAVVDIAVGTAAADRSAAGMIVADTAVGTAAVPLFGTNPADTSVPADTADQTGSVHYLSYPDRRNYYCCYPSLFLPNAIEA